MVKIITVEDIKKIIQRKGLENFFLELIDRLAVDFSRWNQFIKSPRHATYYPHGVIELMPISDDQYYTFKYVNGHPDNPKKHKSTVIAMGLLAEVDSGYPLMIAEMTLLTAFRTAATTALASVHLALPHSNSLGIIGTGAQSEFQILAHHFKLGIDHIYFYDKDPMAMKKMADHLQKYDLKLYPTNDIFSAINKVDIIITATANKVQAEVLKDDWLQPGQHINAIGGDCPGKTELDPKILSRAKVVVENLEQTRLEGEIQNLSSGKIYAELWEIITNNKPGRQKQDEIFLFDSVGFALEDYSILRYVYDLSNEYTLGNSVNLLPALANPKNLFGVLQGG